MILKLVVDTNVFVSAFISGRTALAVLELALSGKAMLYISEAIMAELHETLSRPKFARYIEQQQVTPIRFIHRYTTSATWVRPLAITDCPIQDIDDLIFIECAIVADADYIVTGDQHLLTLQQYRNVKMIKPADLITLVNQT